MKSPIAIGIAFALALLVSPVVAQQGPTKGEPSPTALKHNQQGLAYLKVGKVEEAIAAFKKAAEVAPGYAEAVNNLGYAYEHAGKLDQAIAAYKRTIQLDPNRAVAYLNLGSAYAKKRDEVPQRSSELSKKLPLGEIVRLYRRALELNPNLAEAQAGLGDVYAQTGFLSEAITHYEAYLAKRPKGSRAAEVKKKTAQLQLLTGGDIDQAVQTILEAVLKEHDPFKKGAADIKRAWHQLCGGYLALRPPDKKGPFPVAWIEVMFIPPDAREHTQADIVDDWGDPEAFGTPRELVLPKDLRPPAEEIGGFQTQYIFWLREGKSSLQNWRSEEELSLLEDFLGSFSGEIKAWQTRDGQIELGIHRRRSYSGTGAYYDDEVYLLRLIDNRWQEMWGWGGKGGREGGQSVDFEDIDGDGIYEGVVRDSHSVGVFDVGLFGATAGTGNIEVVKIFKKSNDGFSLASEKVDSTPVSTLTLFLRKLMDKQPDGARRYAADPKIVQDAQAWHFDQVTKWGAIPDTEVLNGHKVSEGLVSFQFGGEAGESDEKPSGAAAQKYKVEMRQIKGDWIITGLTRILSQQPLRKGRRKR